MIITNQWDGEMLTNSGVKCWHFGVNCSDFFVPSLHLVQVLLLESIDY